MREISSPHGTILRKVATHSTTPVESSEAVRIQHASETVEVIVSDSRMLSMGSQFGHVAIIMDGIEYGRANPGWDTDTKEHYLFRQQVSMHRDSWGYVLRISPQEKQNILSEIHRRMATQKAYSLIANSCSSNVAEILEGAGIMIHDPRFEFMDVISPADLMVGLQHSKRLVKKNVYPKK